MLGCFSDIGAVVVQGAAALEQVAGAMGAGSLGMYSGGDESASPHSPQKKKKNPPLFLAWIALL